MCVCYNWINVNFVILGLKKKKPCCCQEGEAVWGHIIYHTLFPVSALHWKSCLLHFLIVVSGFFLKHFHSDKCPVFKLCCREVIEHKKQEREEMMRRKIQTHNKNVKQLVGGFVTADILMSLVTHLRTFPSVHVSRIKWVRNLHLPSTPNEKKTLETHLQ